MREKIFTDLEIAKILDVKHQVNKYWLQGDSRITGMTDYVIAGGCFASIFHRESPRDIDMFLLNCTTWNADVILKTNIVNGANYKLSTGNYINNPNIINCLLDSRSKIQYIFTKYTNRVDLLKHFDYVHCCASFDGKQLYIGRTIYDAIMNKRLIVNCPKQYLGGKREMRFLEKGWKKD